MTSINKIFEALSHPARRRILRLLRDKEMSAGALADHFDFSKPTLSVHLKKLKEADLVSIERKGTTINYFLHLSVLEEALASMLSLKEGDSDEKE